MSIFNYFLDQLDAISEADFSVKQVKLVESENALLRLTKNKGCHTKQDSVLYHTVKDLITFAENYQLLKSNGLSFPISDKKAIVTFNKNGYTLENN